MNKNITLIFPVFEHIHFGKDVFLVPYYLGKKYNSNINIVYPISDTNKDLPEKVRNVNLISLKSNFLFRYFFRYKSFILFWFLIKNAKKINVLINFHWTKISFVQVMLYKFLNRKGISYVKLDTSDGNFLSLKNCRFRFIKEKIYGQFISQVDLFSCETSKSYVNLTSDILFGPKIKDKLTLMANGFDEECFKRLEIKELEYSEKDNLLITVGRIGAEEKNSEMLLESLEYVKLKNWKVAFIGPIENNFKKTISTFYNNNPDKRNSVLFTGPIYNKKELWDYFNRSKVFILTSYKEGSPIVYIEARRFRNFVISTEFPAFVDNILNDDLGCSVSQNNPEELSKIIQSIIDDKLNINKYNNNHLYDISWSKKIELLNLKI